MNDNEYRSLARRTVLYVTIDPFDHRDAAGELRGHGPNLARVREAAASWRPEATMRDLWCGHIAEETLADPSLLALFLSGSYTDWLEAFRQPDWQRLLDRFCALIRQTSAPTFAVCGSHQLVAYAYGGWKAVGHMAPSGQDVVSIADESDGVSRAPDPRIGEVGTYLYRRETDDPLFDGLTASPDDPLIFSQWHLDQVLPGDLPAVSLVSPAGLHRAAQDPTFDRGRHVRSAEECCQVQALRYNVQPAGRILYTTQFHPDLAGADSIGNSDHGIGLLNNFLTLSERYWRAV